MAFPTVSVCTTIYNEGPILAKCLKSFRAQLEPDDEIVICDAGSTDNSPQIEQRYASLVISHPFEGEYPITRGKGRQIAGERSSGDIIVSTDGDVIVPEGYIDRIKHYFQDHPEVSFVYGPIYDLKGRIPRNIMGILASKYLKGVGCNSAYRRNIFEGIRGYKDINWWEDCELFKDFPEEKHYINNPIFMELDSRWAESYWIIAFAILGISYMAWKKLQGEPSYFVTSLKGIF